jgi:hypothetical protein
LSYYWKGSSWNNQEGVCKGLRSKITVGSVMLGVFGVLSTATIGK